MTDSPDLGAAIDAGARAYVEFVANYRPDRPHLMPTTAEKVRAVLEAALPALLATGWSAPPNGYKRSATSAPPTV
jgi:hypothetical protein